MRPGLFRTKFISFRGGLIEMPELRLLANMNISPETVNALKEKGIDIVRVSEILPVTSSDQEILDLARRENRIVVTQDLDFSSLLALGGFNRPSLVTLRMTVSDPKAVTRKLLDLLPELQDMLAKGCAVSVDDFSYRVRWLPIR
jgi:predicted nuclease of predicted toxin-antitoxin system